MASVLKFAVLMSSFLLCVGDGIIAQVSYNSTTSDPNSESGLLFNSTKPSIVFLNPKEYVKLTGIRWLKLADGNLVTVLENGTVLVFKQYDMMELIKEINATGNKNVSEVCSQGLCAEMNENNEEFAQKFGTFQLFNKDIPGFAVLTTVYTFIGVIGVIGNILTLVGVLTAKKLQNSTGVLVCSLAACDIIVLGFCLPLELCQHFFLNTFQLDSFLCKAIHYVKYLSIVVSTNSMACMAMDRFIAICRPLHAKIYCTVSRARLTVLLIWIISLSICIPIILLARVIEVSSNPPIRRCVLVKETTNQAAIFNGVFLVVVFAIPLLVMLPAYLKISFVLWKSTKAASKLQGTSKPKNEDDPKTESMRSRMQVIKMLITLLVVFVVCWGPVCVFEFLKVKMNHSSREVTKVILLSLGLSNSFLNPVIYFSMSKTFRGFMLSALEKVFYCRKTPPNSGTSTETATRVFTVSSSIRRD